MESIQALSVSFSLLFFGGYSFGSICRSLWRPDDNTTSGDILIDTALGLGIYSLIVFALASLGFASSIVYTYLSFIPVILLFLSWRRTARSTRSARPAIFGRWALILLIVLALAALIPALAPPSGSDWDSLAYHLSIPKLYLEHGGIHRIGFSSHSNFPFLMEMLYMPCLALKSPIAAKLMHYWVGVLLIGAVALLVRRHFNAKAAPLAAVVLAGMPIVLWEATTAYIDLSTALYTVLCVHLLLNYFDTNNRRYLLGCGICAGFAASTKMTGLALIPTLGLWVLVERYFTEKKQIEWKSILTFAGVALLVCSPWYIKSLIYTGNPVYPFFYSIFGGRNWTQELADNYTRSQAMFGVGHQAGNFLLLPYDLTFFSERFYDRPGLFIGPIMLVATPLLFFARYRSRKLKGLLLFFLSQVLIWFGLTQQSRYLIPAFAILAALIAVVAYDDDRLRFVRPALWVAFVITALFGVTTLLPSIIDAAPVAFGTESKDAYLSRTLDVYPAQKWMNEHLPKNAIVAFYGDTRGFYLDRDYVWADPGHNAAFTRDFGSVDDMVSYLKTQGVTHAMINFGIFPPFDKAQGTGLLIYKAIEEERFRSVYPDGDKTDRVAVYEIR